MESMDENQFTMYQNLFSGNPAAIVIMKDKFLSDEKMMKIAAENNLSETSFLLHLSDNKYYIRWFAPKVEAALCGHATLATSHVVFEHLGLKGDEIIYETKFSGELRVKKFRDEQGKTLMKMNFPTDKKASTKEVTEELKETFKKSFSKEGISYSPLDIRLGDNYWLVQFKTKKSIVECEPKLDLLAKTGKPVCITSVDEDGEYDFVLRFFAPTFGIPEDPVTGSIQCLLSRFWNEKLKKDTFKVKQLSERSGELLVKYCGERTEISGQCVTFFKGIINV